MTTVFSDSPFMIGNALDAIGRDARRLQAPLYDQWLSVYDKLAAVRSDPFRASNGHIDANIDLILRAFEDEQVQLYNKTGSHRDGGAFFLQISLSQGWLLTTYELLRTTCTHVNCVKEVTKPEHDEATCFGCRILEVKKSFSLVRMPLAKFEPEGYRRKEVPPSKIKTESHATSSQVDEEYPGHGRYHPQLAAHNSNGSLGWVVFDKKQDVGRTISRRELSDALLELSF